MLERPNQENRLRTRVVRIFPKHGSCLQFIGALAVETNEGWFGANLYLNQGLSQGTERRSSCARPHDCPHIRPD